jgi:hypothetical protein
MRERVSAKNTAIPDGGEDQKTVALGLAGERANGEGERAGNLPSEILRGLPALTCRI